MPQYYAVKILADGTTTIIETPEKVLPLEWLQGQIGGYIEILDYLQAPLVALCDEEGFLKHLPQNARMHCACGPILIVKVDLNTSDLIGVSKESAESIVRTMDRAARSRVV